FFFFFSSRRRHTRFSRDWSSDVCSSDLTLSDLYYEGDNLRDYFAVNYFTQAKKVLKKYPKGNENLAIPTWFYGHEPSNLFASSIAKYFSNSIREDTLLAICLYGIVFAPGS